MIGADLEDDRRARFLFGRLRGRVGRTSLSR